VGVCRTHYAANLMSATPKASWPWVRAMLHSVYDQPDTASVHAQYDRLLEAVADKLPKVAEHLDAARADVLAFTGFPKELWRQIWSNNPKNASTARSAGARTSSGSSPTRTPSSGSSVPSWPSSTTSGPKAADTSASTSSREPA
jgi:putative transposase